MGNDAGALFGIKRHLHEVVRRVCLDAVELRQPIVDIEVIRQQQLAIVAVPNGDFLLRIHVLPHPVFERRGDDLSMTLPVEVQDAVVGKDMEIKTVFQPAFSLQHKRAVGFEASRFTAQAEAEGFRSRPTARAASALPSAFSRFAISVRAATNPSGGNS